MKAIQTPQEKYDKYMTAISNIYTLIQKNYRCLWLVDSLISDRIRIQTKYFKNKSNLKFYTELRKGNK